MITKREKEKEKAIIKLKHLENELQHLESVELEAAIYDNDYDYFQEITEYISCLEYDIKELKQHILTIKRQLKGEA